MNDAANANATRGTVDAVAERFDQAWREGGEPPNIVCFLRTDRFSLRGPIRDLSAGDVELFEELLKIDLEYRWRRGIHLGLDATQLEHYASPCDRFPSIQLVAEEYWVRQHWGDQPDRLQYLRRFPQLSDELPLALERVDDELRREFGEQADRPIDEESDERDGGQRGDETNLPAIPGYRIHGILGRGGMAIVYRASQTRPRRDVALKMILTGRFASTTELARFHAEVDAVASLQHPNIVQIHEVGEHLGQPYCALELIEGGSLAEQLDGTPRDPRTSAELIRRLAEAMHTAHSTGVIHRDLKPANILLATSDRPEAISFEQTKQIGSKDLRPFSFEPKVADFGLVKRIDSLQAQTQTGELLGTPGYMAPEQVGAHSDRISPRTDVYALGAMLYELVTGRPPFQGATTLETLRQVQSKEPVAPRQLQPTLPRDLETIAQQCLQKDPAKRYATSRDLANDLARFLRNEPVKARRIGGIERMIKWARRNPARAGLVVVSAIALICVIIGSTLYNRRLQVEVERANASEVRAQRQKKTVLDNFEQSHEAMLAMLERLWRETRADDDPRGQRLHDDLLRSMRAYYENTLRDADESDPDIALAKGNNYVRLAQVDHYLARYDDAEKGFAHARELLEPLALGPSSSQHAKYSLGLCLFRWAITCQSSGQAERAEPLLFATLEAVSSVREVSPKISRLRARSHRTLATLFFIRQQLPIALRHGEQAVEHFQQVDLKQPTPQNRRLFAHGLQVLTAILARLNDRERAEATTSDCDALVQEWILSQPQNALELSGLTDLANCHYLLAHESITSKEYERAILDASAGINVVERVLAVNPGFPDGRGTMHALHKSRADALEGLGRWSEAVEAWDRAVEFGDSSWRDQAMVRRELAQSTVRMQLESSSSPAHNEPAFNEPAHNENVHPTAISRALKLREEGLEHTKRESTEEAMQAYTLAIDLLAELNGKEQLSFDQTTRDTLHHLYWLRAMSNRRLRRLEQALSDWNRAVEISGGEPGTRIARCRVLLQVGEFSKAQSEAEDVVAKTELAPATAFDLALFCGQAVSALRRADEPNAVKRDQMQQHFVAVATDAVKRCESAGYFDDFKNYQNLKTNPLLNSLRMEKSFQDLMNGFDVARDLPRSDIAR